MNEIKKRKNHKNMYKKDLYLKSMLFTQIQKYFRKSQDLYRKRRLKECVQVYIYSN